MARFDSDVLELLTVICCFFGVLADVFTVVSYLLAHAVDGVSWWEGVSFSLRVSWVGDLVWLWRAQRRSILAISDPIYPSKPAHMLLYAHQKRHVSHLHDHRRVYKYLVGTQFPLLLHTHKGGLNAPPLKQFPKGISAAPGGWALCVSKLTSITKNVVGLEKLSEYRDEYHASSLTCMPYKRPLPH